MVDEAGSQMVAGWRRLDISAHFRGHTRVRRGASWYYATEW